MSSPDHEDLQSRAKEYVEKLPAETALGNADPAGGVATDPKEFDEKAQSQDG